MKKHYRSRFPALNVARRHEAVATDTVYSDTKAIDDGSTCAQIFIGRETMFADAYGMKTDKEFVNTLEDNIRRRGAMDTLISDQAQAEVSKRVIDLIRAYCVKDWQSEAYHQHQNFGERRYQTIKQYVDRILDRSGAPAYCWLLCLLYVCYLLNRLSTKSLDNKTPYFCLTGQMADISALLQYHFYEEVYYLDHTSRYPSKSREKIGYWVGVAEHVGDALTYKVLTKDTKKIIYVSEIRSAEYTNDPNLRVAPSKGEKPDIKPIKIIKDRHDFQDELEVKHSDSDFHSPLTLPTLPTFDPSDLIGRTFLTKPNEDGERFRARVMRPILDESKTLKLLLKFDDDKADEICAYNEVLDHINSQMEDEIDQEQTLTKFRAIKDHKGPLDHKDSDYKHSKYNVLIEWETGEITWEPLSVIARDDPVTCALYAKENNLLNLDGWKQFRKLAKRQKKMVRAINQSKLIQVRRSARFKFGFQVPRTYDEAIEIDNKNGNTKWQDAIKLEMDMIDAYKTFKDHGKAIYKGKALINAPEGYQRIRVHLVFDVKHDGRHKARLVAGGHLTGEPVESVYSSVVSLRSLRIVTFLNEMNKLELWGADIGNAYLEAYTEEKVFIVAGGEFGDRKGHILIIERALYGLKTSGKRWHERFAACMKDLGFSQCKSDQDVWMRPSKDRDCYEYVACYVDDLLISMKDPKEFCDILKTKFNFKLKGDGPIEYHLGLNYSRDPDGTLVLQPKKYIEKMMESYNNMFGNMPKKYTSPLEPDDHPEVDESELCNEDDTAKYLTMIGQLQWLVTLGRFDIFSAVITMSRFRAAPKTGHLSRLKRIFGYVLESKDGATQVRCGCPDFSHLQHNVYDWEKTIYGDVKEVLPDDMPEPMGKEIVLTTYVDANLYHDWVTGRALTGILHLINQTPFDWFCKRQSTVETATYGSEFNAACIAVNTDH